LGRAGNIVTNNHVVAGASELAVRFGSGGVVQADIVSTDPNLTSAVLLILQWGGSWLGFATGLRQYRSNVAQAGYAIGNPYGLDRP
jgi:putative serine protease PepD